MDERRDATATEDARAPRASDRTAQQPPDASTNHGASVIVPYVLGLVVLVASAVVMSLVLDSGWNWVISLLGAAVIAVLLSAAALPHLSSRGH